LGYRRSSHHGTCRRSRGNSLEYFTPFHVGSPQGFDVDRSPTAGRRQCRTVCPAPVGLKDAAASSLKFKILFYIVKYYLQ
jgi:hypothetical protein